jgi:ketosteroid isomerase-like protein
MSTTAVSQVIASEAALLDAMRASNADLLDTLLHDDLLFNGPTGQTATKAADLANYRSGNIHLHTVRASDHLFSEIGDDVIVAVTVELGGSYMGQQIDGRFRYLRVWKRLGDRWQVIAGSVGPLHDRSDGDG